MKEKREERGIERGPRETLGWQRNHATEGDFLVCDAHMVHWECEG